MTLNEMLKGIEDDAPSRNGAFLLDVMLASVDDEPDAPMSDVERIAIQPPEDLMAPRDPAGLGMEPWRVRERLVQAQAQPQTQPQPQTPLPEGGVIDALRQGAADIVRGWGPGQMDTEYLDRLQEVVMQDETFQGAIDAGLVDRQDLWLQALSPVQRVQELGKEIADRARLARAVDDLAGWIAPKPHAKPENALPWMAYKGAEMLPGVGRAIAEYTLFGGPGVVMFNAARGADAANERVYQNLKNDGADVLEARKRATDPIGALPDTAARMAANVATMGLLGRAPIVGGALSPLLQTLLNVAGASAVSGGGGAAGSAITDVRSGRDVDVEKALEAGASDAAGTAMFGGIGALMRGGKLLQQQRAHRDVNAHVARHNAAVTKRGFKAVDGDFSLQDSAEQIENAIKSGLINRAEARSMLIEAGYPEEIVSQTLQGMAKEARLGARAQQQSPQSAQNAQGAQNAQSLAIPAQSAPRQPTAEEMLAAARMGQVQTPPVQTPEPAPVANPEPQRRTFPEHPEGIENMPPDRQAALGTAEGMMMGGATLDVIKDRAGWEVGPGWTWRDSRAEAQTGQQPGPQPEPRSAIEPKQGREPIQGAGDAVAQEANKKWALPEGYAVEGSEDTRTLKGTKQHQFVLRDGKKDWGQVTEALTHGDPDIPIGPVRVQVGQRGWGLRHAKEKHSKDSLAGYPSVEAFISHIIDDGNDIIPLPRDDRGRQTEFLIARVENARNQDVIVIAWDEQGGYYTLKTAYSPSTEYLEKHRSPSPGSNSPASSPAPTSIPSDTATASATPPEGIGDRQHYEDSDHTPSISQSNTAKVRTANGTEIDVKYRIVSADDLKTSHDERGETNPDYPQELQPRQRNRNASRQQVEKIAHELDPTLLGENRMASDGAPIIEPDGVVESGNGRVMAIRRAYQLKKGDGYAAWLRENAAKFGLSEADIDGVKNPVLVRERTSEVDRAKFASEANQSTVSRMSRTEQAMSDAERLSPETLSLFDTERGVADNREFIEAFAREVVGENEMGGFLQADGRLSQEGLQRVTNALFARAYGSTEALNRLNESLDDTARNVSNAMTQAAPKMAALEHAIAGGGAKAELSLKEDIAQAAETLARIRREGGTVADFLVQRVLSPEMDISPEAKTLLQFFDANRRSAKKIAAALNRYAELALNEGSPNQMSLFETETPATKGEMLKAALEGEAQDISSLAGKANERVNKSLPPKENPQNLNAVAPGMRPDIDPQTNPHVEAAEPAQPKQSRFEFDDAETEARYAEAKKGVKPEGAMQRIARAVKEFTHGFKGDYPLLAGKKDLIAARETLRRLNRERGVAAQNAVTILRNALKDLSHEEFDLFTRKRLLDDMAWRKQEVPDAKLPFGLTDESLAREKARFDKLASENEKVRAAIEADERAVRDVNNRMIEMADKLGWTQLRDSLKNPHYFRHQVLEYAEMRDREGRVGIKAPTDRGFLKRFRGSELDINANYIQANGEVRALQMQDIQVLEALVELKEKYDIGDRLRSEAKESGKKLQDVIPEGYVRWSPFGRGLTRTTDSAAAQILDAALGEGARQLGLPLDDMLNIMDEAQDAGAKSRMWVIPAELASTLNRVGAKRERMPALKLVKEITSGLKSWVLFSPTRVIQYNIRNVTGDMDALIAGNPRAIPFIKQAWGELKDVYFEGRAAEGELHEFQQRGGGLTSESVQELYDWRKMREFAHLMDKMKNADMSAWKKLKGGAWKVIDGYWDRAKRLTEFREQVLRYACYLSYLDQIQKSADGKPANWGASNPDEVMAVEDIRDRAFKMANELLGAYDQVSKTGQELRDIAVWFYSWLEVNAKRYFQLLKNGFASDAPGDFAARLLQAHAVKTPLYAYRAAKTLLMVNLFSWAIQAFNRFVMGDDDDELTPDIRERPHITLGRDANGRVLYFDRIGATMDVLDWFALDSFASDIKDILNGQLTVTGYLKKMGSAPFSKAMNALNPLIKMPTEMAMGRTMYPDVFHPRAIRDIGTYIASSLGLTWEYRAATGQPGPKYLSWDRMRSLFFYSQDAEEGAYFYIQDKKREFQERVLGKSFDGFATSRRGNALRRLKTSIRFNDEENIKRSMQQYADAGGTKKGLESSMTAMDPLNGLTKQERGQFIAWLTKEDRKFLERAMRYYAGVRGTVMQ